MAAHDDLKAHLVIDRFHVAQHYRDDFDHLRKQELKRMKKELPAELYEQDCKGTLWLLRKTMLPWMRNNVSTCGVCCPILPSCIKLIPFGKN